jgi:hypothetical protein
MAKINMKVEIANDVLDITITDRKLIWDILRMLDRLAPERVEADTAMEAWTKIRDDR